MSKRFLAVLAAVIVGLGIIFWASSKNSPTTGGSKTNTSVASHHVTGGGKKGVTLIEYGDFQCPACYSYEPIMEQIRVKYKDDITFQFRNFPLPQHQNARAGARAAEAAAKQNKYWEMHDLLYKNQDPNGQTGWVASSNPLDSFFDTFAKQLNLDITKFNQDFNSPEANDVINADQKLGNAFGVSGTPTFDLDGKKIETTDVSTVAAFYKLIDNAIAAKTKK